MQGLKRGTVKLYPHDESWRILAEETIRTLHSVLGDTAKEIAHVGSTSINGIHAKPIIDIAVAVNNIDDILPFTDELEKRGIIFRGSDHEGQYLFVIGDFEKDTRSHHIHIVPHNSDAWDEYINFRDYLNAHPHKAAEYEALKLTLAEKFPHDRISYTSGKSELISRLLEEAKGWEEGMQMNITVKRFSELTTDELYEIMKLRVNVFVVEQNCPYPELDDKDKASLHAWISDDDGIVAYCRVLPQGVSYEEASIGRVISVKRRMGYGTKIVRSGIDLAKEHFNADKIRIEAQVYARKLYENCGFVQVSDEFLEDGIPHIEMLWEDK